MTLSNLCPLCKRLLYTIFDVVRKGKTIKTLQCSPFGKGSIYRVSHYQATWHDDKCVLERMELDSFVIKTENNASSIYKSKDEAGNFELICDLSFKLDLSSLTREKLKIYTMLS
jgi:hypothetical protein